MGQLIMRWKNDGVKTDMPSITEGVTLKNWTSVTNPVDKWLDIVSFGLSDKRESVDYYEKMNYRYKAYTPESCWFFCLKNEEVATITVICDKDAKEGYVHMVANKPAARGLGIGNLMSKFAVYELKKNGMQTAYLTTDDWRIPAIKTYLKAGFTPDLTSEKDFKERWDAILKIINEKETGK